VDDLGVDALALSGHKFYGPKGVGVTFLRRGLDLLPMQTGGGHEGKRRAIHRLLQAIPQLIPDTRITGHPQQRLSHHASFLFAGIEIQGVLMGLDMAGIAASSGSACTSAAQSPSSVLTAMGVDPVAAAGHLRLTLGRSTTAADIERVLQVLPPLVQRLRSLSA